ncbi:MAG: hypothetical protein AAF399_07390 [Bacteroidota bacterium]
MWAVVLSAQPVLQSDADWPVGELQLRPLPASLRGATPDTLSISAANPFWDDFSWQGQEPDSQWWFTGPSLIDVPQLNNQHAVNPPSWGVATFDGRDRQGRPYNVGSLSSGTADRLFSHYLDLSGQSPGNNWVLSFFLQPQGRGEKPEPTDSFFVYFRTPNAPPNDFEKVFAIGGSSIRDFQAYSIELDQARYFHTGFQLLFESVGSLNGALDEWQLDYVYLAPNRSLGDTTFADRSPTALTASPLFPYTAMPLSQYLNQSGVMQDFGVEVSNLGSNAQSTEVGVKLEEALNQTPLVPVFQQDRTLTVGPRTTLAVGFEAFDFQPLDELAALDLSIQTSSNGDQFPENDEVLFRLPLDSVLAYDDGEADVGFGLNQSLGYGIQVDLAEPDSITAVWISFQPQLIYNPIDGTVSYLNEQSFRLLIWDDPHPDSILHVQLGGIKVQYGDRPNHFERYAVGDPIPVPTTFWVGVQQVDSKPLGVGYDFNFNSDRRTFYDSLGNWVNVSLGGSLMIRPEFFNPFQVPANVEEVRTSSPVRVFPNPLDGQSLTVAFPESWLGETVEVHLMDLQGRQLFQQHFRPLTEAQPVLSLPVSLPAGWYWLSVRGEHHPLQPLHLQIR